MTRRRGRPSIGGGENPYNTPRSSHLASVTGRSGDPFGRIIPSVGLRIKRRDQGWVVLSGLSKGLAYVGTTITGMGGGLSSIDISDLPTAQEIGFLETSGKATGIELAGTLAYVAASTGVMIVDISDPTAPTTVGSLHFPGDSHRVAVGGNVAYVAHRSVGLKVIDISNSAAPIELTTYVIADGDVRDVLVAGGLAYVAASEPGRQRPG